MSPSAAVSSHVSLVPPPRDRASRIVRAALAHGVLDQASTAVAFIDLDALSHTVEQLKAAFPGNVSHRFAVKANGLTGFLARLREMGLGAEAASPGELALCRHAGFAPAEISYNSPAKTVADHIDCLSSGIAFSLDNEEEFRRVRRLVADRDGLPSIGFRVNTQVGAGGIAATGTAAATSKFGYALTDPGSRDRLVAWYLNTPWLDMLHVHTGSQGVPISTMVESVALVVELAREIDQMAGRPRIRCINIGGGLPVDPDPDVANPGFDAYARALRERVPDLFSGRYRVETEFGRSIAAACGTVVTRVEYVKQAAGRRIALTHAGAQIAARTAYAPGDWPLHVTVLDGEGKMRSGPRVPTDVAGPCCFAGDVICSNRDLEEIQAGDFLVIHNVGAYYFSAHFDFNYLPRLGVYGFHDAGAAFECLRKPQSLADIVMALS